MSTLAKSHENLIWVDCEMTGLELGTNHLLEVAVRVTDPTGHVESPPIECVIHHPFQVFEMMDPWNMTTHTRNGLIEKSKASITTMRDAQKKLLEFVEQYVPKGSSPLCGYRVGQDRRFLEKDMPMFAEHFHFSDIDMNVFQEMAKRLNKDLRFERRRSNHTGLADLDEAIRMYRHFGRACF